VIVFVEWRSVGFQVGSSLSDVVLLYEDHVLKSLVRDRYRIGADATVGSLERHFSSGPSGAKEQTPGA
jgi:lipid-binding SYLF domain-containing protein